jgi:hypothetical protein
MVGTWVYGKNSIRTIPRRGENVLDGAVGFERVRTIPRTCQVEAIDPG